MDPATIGTVLGGIGSIASGFGLGKSKADPEYQAAVQQQTALRHERESFNQKMQLAQEHGLHPLSVLGVPVSTFSPAVSFGGEERYNLRDVGYGIEQLGKGLVKPGGVGPEQHPAPVEDSMESTRKRILEGQARRVEADAGLAELELQQRTVRAGMPPAASTSNDVEAMRAAVARQSGIPLSYLGASGGRDGVVKVEQQVAPPHPGIPGHAAASDQAWLRVVDKDGKQVSVIRNDAVNADIEKGATFQALASLYGVENALRITAILENEGLLMGGVALGGYAMRHPVAKAGQALIKLFSRIPSLKKNITAPKGGNLKWSDRGRDPRKDYFPDIIP